MVGLCLLVVLGHDAQWQDSVLRSFNPLAGEFIGLSNRVTNFIIQGGRYIMQFRTLRNVTDLGKYIDEPNGVSGKLAMPECRCSACFLIVKMVLKALNLERLPNLS